jgi:hypothetical protein
MWPFDRRPRINIADFIEREAAKVFAPGYADSVRELLQQAGFPNPVEAELVAFRFWITLAGASLAKLPDNVQRGLWRRVYEQIERNHGRAQRERFETTCVEYLRLMTKDMERATGAQFMPDTLSFALNRIVGESNETVVSLRMALIAFAFGLMKSESDFFRDIRLIR